MNDDNMEAVYEDTTAWTYFKGEDESETIGVYGRCPECSRYVTKGTLKMNMAGEIKLEGWKCNKHGEIQPYYDRDCNYQESEENKK